MKRKLQIAWSVACGIICLLLVALWVRGYWWADAFWYRPAETIAFRVMSDEGGLTFLALQNISLRVLGDPPPPGLSHRDYWYAGYARATDENSAVTKVFRGFHDRLRGTWQIPHWIVLLLAAAIGALPWTGRWGWRFSLRTLLITTTLVAVVLGMIVWAVQ